MRQRVLQTSWEIEEANRTTLLLEILREEQEEQFKFAERELNFFEVLACGRGILQLREDKEFFYALFTEDYGALEVADEQYHQFKQFGGHTRTPSPHVDGDLQKDSQVSGTSTSKVGELVTGL